MSLDTVQPNRLDKSKDYNFTGALQQDGNDVLTTASTAIDAAAIGDGSVSNEEFQRLDGVTSDIQDQINDRAESGNNSDITELSGLTTPLSVAQGGTGQTTETAALNALLPSQTGNSGKFLQSNGTNTAWGVASLALVPIQYYMFGQIEQTLVPPKAYFNQALDKITYSNSATEYSVSVDQTSKVIKNVSSTLALTSAYLLVPYVDSGTYYFVGITSGTPDSWYRYDDDFTNETLLTSTGATDVTTLASGVSDWNASENELWFLDAVNSTTIRRYTISGTTITNASTATLTLDTAPTAAKVMIITATALYIIDDTGNDYQLRTYNKTTGAQTSIVDYCSDTRIPISLYDKWNDRVYIGNSADSATMNGVIILNPFIV